MKRLILIFGAILFVLFSTNFKALSQTDNIDSIVFNGGYRAINSAQLNMCLSKKSDGTMLKNDVLLSTFFPGKLYFDTNIVSMSSFIGDAGVSLWKCTDCIPSKFNYIMDDTLKFIDTLLYDSRLLMRTGFTDKDNNQFAIAAFNTTPYQSDFMLTGRFTPGLLSVALLKFDTDGWKTVFFNPIVGTFGQFCMAPKPQLVQIVPNKYVITFKDYDGGFGGPFMATQFFYSIDNNGCNLQFTLPESDFVYTEDSYWNTKIVPSVDDKNKDIVSFVTEGVLLKKDFAPSDFIDVSILPENLQPLIAKKSKVQFTINRSYRLVNGSFVLLDSTLKSK